ncbi:MAG: TonB family protein [Gammaproteobacteria bacterium]
MIFQQSNYSTGSSDMMAMAISFAIILHAAGIFGISFSGNDEQPDMKDIEVILVQQSSEEAPEEVDFLAQANSEGGGESEETERPATPFVAPNPEQSPEIVTPSSIPFEPMNEQKLEKQVSEAGLSVVEEEPENEPEKEQDKPKEKQEIKAEELIAVETKNTDVQIPKPQSKPKAKPVETEKPEPKNQPQAQPETPSATELMSRSLSMASLSAEIDRRLEAKAKRPRRDFISASTREYKYASYMEAWRAKVERIGNINYPNEARMNQLSGILRMTVALNADGTINEITIDKSSGHQVLDDAALQIVRLASPYAAFPENIRKTVDILHITRTWKFLHNSTFSGK